MFLYTLCNSFPLKRTSPTPHSERVYIWRRFCCCVLFETFFLRAPSFFFFLFLYSVTFKSGGGVSVIQCGLLLLPSFYVKYDRMRAYQVWTNSSRERLTGNSKYGCNECAVKWDFFPDEMSRRQASEICKYWNELSDNILILIYFIYIDIIGGISRTCFDTQSSVGTSTVHFISRQYKHTRMWIRYVHCGIYSTVYKNRPNLVLLSSKRVRVTLSFSIVQQFSYTFFGFLFSLSLL